MYNTVLVCLPMDFEKHFKIYQAFGWKAVDKQELLETESVPGLDKNKLVQIGLTRSKEFKHIVKLEQNYLDIQSELNEVLLPKSFIEKNGCLISIILIIFSFFLDWYILTKIAYSSFSTNLILSSPLFYIFLFGIFTIISICLPIYFNSLFLDKRQALAIEKFKDSTPKEVSTSKPKLSGIITELKELTKLNEKEVISYLEDFVRDESPLHFKE